MRNNYKLTILILSFERQEELKKKINYWNNINDYKFKIIIIDGSSKCLKIKIKNNKIKYYHFKSRDYHKRAFYALKHIKTEYFKLEAEDDYFLPSSLQSAIKFLDKNKNYSAVYGDAGIYSIYKNKLFINHIFKKRLNLNSNDFKKRLNTYFLNYSPKLYYSVMRTHLFKRNLDLWKSSKKNYGDKFQRFAEIHLPLILLLSGKVRVLNKIFWIRKDDDIQNRVEFTSNKRLIKDDHTYTNISKWFLKNSKKGYFDIFGNSLCNITKISNFNQNYIIYELLQKYFFIGIYKANNNNKFINKMIKLIKYLLPSKFKKFLRFNLKLNGPALIKCDELKKELNINYNFIDLKYLRTVLLKK
tara:strand:- start:4456 stop:5529 length:1074 start_codon:yes stop_codon:yes gene_type:complete